MRDFFGCYLLVSKAPQGKGRTYIGFTVNPRRRIRQHNGLIKAGAWKTSKWRPWEMTLVLYGFPTKIQALQFEWAWQHPQKSVIVKPIAQALGSKKLVGVRGKILLMLNMLHESPWRHFPLTLQYLDPQYASMVKESVASAPAHVHVFTAPMDELPKALDDLDDDASEGGDEAATQEPGAANTLADVRADQGADGDGADSGSDGTESKASDASDGSSSDADEPQEVLASRPQGSRQGGQSAKAPAAASTASAAAACGPSAANGRSKCNICQLAIQRHILVCSSCGVHFHLDCLATRWSSEGLGCSGGGGGGGGGGQERDRFGGVPEQGRCPGCGTLHSWMAMLQGMQTVGWGNKPRGRRGRVAKKAGKAVDQSALAMQAIEEGEEAGNVPQPAAKPRKRPTKPKAAPTAATGEGGPSQLLASGSGAEAQGSIGDADASGLQGLGLAVAQTRKTRSGAAGKGRRKADAAAAAGAEPSQALAGADDAAGEAGKGCAAGKRASKPRAPKGRAAVGAAKAGELPGAGGGSGVAKSDVIEKALPGPTAMGDGAPAQTESPSKRRCRDRLAAPRQVHEPQPLGGGLQLSNTAAAEETGDPSRQREDASPVPLWKRLQARVGSASASVPIGPGLAQPQAWRLGDDGHGADACESGSGSDAELLAGPDRQRGAASQALPRGSTQAAAVVSPTRVPGPRGQYLRSPELVILGTSSEDSDSEGAEVGGEGGVKGEGSAGASGVTQPGAASGAPVLAPSSGLPGTGVSDASGRCANAFSFATGAGAVPDIAVPSQRRLLGSSWPASDGPAAMDMSPPPIRNASAALRAAALDGPEEPCGDDSARGAGTLAFGSPAFGEVEPALGPGYAASSTEAGGSAGGGVTRLMAGLHCASTTSPEEELRLARGDAVSDWALLGRAEAAAPTINAFTAQASDPAPSFTTAVHGRAGPAVDPSRHLQARTSPHADPKVPAHAGGTGDRSWPFRQPLTEVVDLCSPLPLSSRLAHKAVADADGEAGGQGPRAAGPAGVAAGKRLRSPKPGVGPAVEPVCASAGQRPPTGTHAGGTAPQQSPSWTVSPWPVRRRCDIMEQADCDEDVDWGQQAHPVDSTPCPVGSLRAEAANCGRSKGSSSTEPEASGEAGRGNGVGEGQKGAVGTTGAVNARACANVDQARAGFVWDDDDVIVID